MISSPDWCKEKSREMDRSPTPQRLKRQFNYHARLHFLQYECVHYQMKINAFLNLLTLGNSVGSWHGMQAIYFIKLFFLFRWSAELSWVLWADEQSAEPGGQEGDQVVWCRVLVIYFHVQIYKQCFPYQAQNTRILNWMSPSCFCFYQTIFCSHLPQSPCKI